MTKKQEAMFSKKGEAFKRLMDEIHTPAEKLARRRAVQMSVNVPIDLLDIIDRMSDHLGTTRTRSVIMLLEASLAEVAAEGKAGLGKLFAGVPAKNERSMKRST